MKKKAKQKKTKKFWYSKQFFAVVADVFDTDVLFCINATEEEIKAHLKKLVPKRYNDFDETELNDWDKSKTALGRMIPFSGGFLVLLRADKDKFRKFTGILVHEVTHVTHYLLKDRRIPLTNDTEEVYAYLTEHLIYQALIKLY